ncbi:hypothetical protein EG68_04468 [Paragonimus skrjabini miyazakii]|uniref:Uncharacterized protein n=1 Tax=Paragonimus skrjabini miyazakii TaxID=59628 RepID=A0A8S9YXN4_9TREM|nr:hypothetical protein EG68_04468 [Paragonimus skrjabini miyazakii]
MSPCVHPLHHFSGVVVSTSSHDGRLLRVSGLPQCTNNHLRLSKQIFDPWTAATNMDYRKWLENDSAIGKSYNQKLLSHRQRL